MKALLVVLLLSGCATAPPSGFTFTDVPSRKAPVMVISLQHRLASAEDVAATCSWRNRVAGNGPVKMHPTSPACSWTEADGTKVVLCTNPKSFNNAVALEACGHEAFHHHEVVDHP